MIKHLTLKLATMADAEILFQWRNDPETKKVSIDTDDVEWEDHLEWLQESLKNPNRQIFIAWADILINTALECSIIQPVGIVRVDYTLSDDTHELSWTVSPRARGQGTGKKIVAILASQLVDKDICAVIKPDNNASIRIAGRAGMKYQGQQSGYFYYFRKGE